jgi:phytol kinase
MLNNNLLATIITFMIALIWLRVNDFAAERSWISSRLSRKIIHIGTGPIFVLCWLLFSPSPWSRYLAALVPLTITIQFFLVGSGILKDEAAVQALSRSGDRREIIKGPLYYGIIFVLLTAIYWLDTPIGIIALMLMCGGDGLADILGRRYGYSKLPWNPSKSWIGTLGMLLGGWVMTMVILIPFTSLGIFQGQLGMYLIPVTLIAVMGTIVETLPIKDIDNITVTAIALFMGHFVF